MNEQKTISFRGVDDGVNAMLEKLRASAKTTFQDLTRANVDWSKSGSEIVKNLETEIKLLEHKNRLLLESRRAKIDKDYQMAIDYGGEKERKEATSVRSMGRSEAMREFNEQKMQTLLLRELIETVKKTAAEEIKTDREGVEREVSELEENNSRLSEEEHLKLKIQQSKVGKPETSDEQQQEEVRRKPLGFWKTAGAVMVGEFFSDLFKRVSGGVSSGLGSETGEYAAAQFASAIPFVGSTISTIATRALNEAYASQLGYNKFRAISGESPFALTGYGMNYVSTYDRSMEILKASNYGKNIIGRTQDDVALGKRYGIDVTDVEKNYRISNFTSPMMITAMIKALNFAGIDSRGFASGRGDFARMNELLQGLSTISQEQAGILEKIDYGVNINLLREFDKIYGNDPRMVERMMQVNRGLTSPANDYQQAINYSILSRIAPGASYYELREMQEKGIRQPGFLKGMMNFYRSAYTPAMAMEAIRNRFGFSYAQGRKFFEGYEANPDLFSHIAEIGGDEAIKKMIDKERGEVRRQGQSIFTTQKEREGAEVSVAFANDPRAGMEKLISQASDAIKKGMKEIGIIVGEGVKQGFGNLKESINQALGGGTSVDTTSAESWASWKYYQLKGANHWGNKEPDVVDILDSLKQVYNSRGRH